MQGDLCSARIHLFCLGQSW